MSGRRRGQNGNMLKENFVRYILLTIVLVLFSWTVLQGAEKVPAKPTPRDKCPVCGMFVYKYPDFLAEIVFRDGSVAFFDGAKDMFKYYLNMSKYNSRQKATDIESVYVNDYYSLTLVDGLKAYYVQGSDVFGPMGRELIPFEKEREAREFVKDHKGKALLKFQEITDPIIKGLD
jgi:nitrous oxide reductase accessory protein NosL